MFTWEGQQTSLRENWSMKEEKTEVWKRFFHDGIQPDIIDSNLPTYRLFQPKGQGINEQWNT